MAERQPEGLRSLRVDSTVALQAVFRGIYASCLQGCPQIVKIEFCSDRSVGVSVSIAIEFDGKQGVCGIGLDGFLLVRVQFADFDQGTRRVEESNVERNPSVLHPETLAFRAFGKKQHTMFLGQALAVHQATGFFLRRNDHLQLKSGRAYSDGEGGVLSRVTSPFGIFLGLRSTRGEPWHEYGRAEYSSARKISFLKHDLKGNSPAIETKDERMDW